MRLPTGYGTVYKLSGKRRKPYIARKTVGWTDEGKQQYLTIGYYPTKKEALEALNSYNADPYDLSGAKLTFAEVYAKWMASEFNDNSNESSVANYTKAYKHCSKIYDKPIQDLKLPHLQEVINECPNANQASRIKLLLSRMYEWCVQRDYLHRNLADNLTTPKYVQQKFRRAMEKEDIQKLWDLSKDFRPARISLILVYCGVRINELLNLSLEDLKLEERHFFVRKSKTDAGVRIVPIAEKVVPFWEEALKMTKCDKVFTTDKGQPLSYDNFSKRMWQPLMEQLGFDYTIHETRHTCNSLLIMANVNPTIRKKIMGHTSKMDIGEAVYGHIYIEELVKAINTI